MIDFDESSDDEIEQHNRKNIADKASVLVVRDQLPRETAIHRVKEYIEDIDEACKTAEILDGTEEAYEAYLTKPRINFDNLTELQRKQVFVVSQELLDADLV